MKTKCVIVQTSAYDPGVTYLWDVKSSPFPGFQQTETSQK